jgi:hypothetical protein
MEPREPHEPNPAGAEAAGAAEDALRRLEARLERASHAAERLIAEAAAGVARSAAPPAAAAGPAGSAGSPGSGPSPAGKPPPAGWQVPLSDATTGGNGDGEVLAQVIQSLRELIPPDLQRRLAEALHEVLLAVRAVIDWYLTRVEQRRAEPSKVQDIPIQ